MVAEIRNRITARDYDEISRVHGELEDLTADAYSTYVSDGGDLDEARFAEVASIVFDSLKSGPERARDERVNSALGEYEETPDDNAVIIWKPRERVSGYMYQGEVVVDMSSQMVDPGMPLLVQMFYSIRTRDLITYGAALTEIIQDFEQQTVPEGSFPGQEIYGALITGVYKFEPVSRR